VATATCLGESRLCMNYGTNQILYTWKRKVVGFPLNLENSNIYIIKIDLGELLTDVNIVLRSECSYSDIWTSEDLFGGVFVIW